MSGKLSNLPYPFGPHARWRVVHLQSLLQPRDLLLQIPLPIAAGSQSFLKTPGTSLAHFMKLQGQNHIFKPYGPVDLKEGGQWWAGHLLHHCCSPESVPTEPDVPSCCSENAWALQQLLSGGYGQRLWASRHDSGPSWTICELWSYRCKNAEANAPGQS